MATIEELERKVEQLERDILAKDQKDTILIEKSEKAIDFALHAYKVDHYGFIWVWDVEQQGYRKTNMRVMTPEISDRALESRHIANNAIEGRHLQDDLIEGRMVKDKTIEGRSFMDNTIGGEKLQDRSINGDSMEPGSIPNGKLDDNAVSTRNIQNYAVTPVKLDPDLLNQIRSAGEHGYALSGEFGDSTLIGIHQAALTHAFDVVWQKIEEIVGEPLRGFAWEVTPTYFISETAQAISVTAAPLIPGLVFEYIALYNNDTLLTEEENIATFSHSFEITDTSIVRCEAKILGVPYTRLQTVTHYNNFFLGAGSSYADIMDLAHAIPVKRGAYTIPVSDGQRIIIVIGETLRSLFIRADINGMEIPFTETSVTVSGRTYRVFTSQNTYSEGDYNIDING